MTDASAILDFGREYLPDVFTHEFAACHREIAAAIEGGGGQGNHGFVFGGARSHGFTSLLAFLVPLYIICERPATVAVVLASTVTEAREMEARVRHELAQNQPLRRRYPYAPTLRSVAFRGFHGSALRGLRHGAVRPHLVLCDRIAGDLTMLAPDTRARRVRDDWAMLTRVVLPLLGPKGYFVYGGPIHPGDDPLLERLMQDQFSGVYRQRWYPAADGPVDIPGAQPLWPERYDITALRERRGTMPVGEFAREWLGRVGEVYP